MRIIRSHVMEQAGSGSVRGRFVGVDFFSGCVDWWFRNPIPNHRLGCFFALVNHGDFHYQPQQVSLPDFERTINSIFQLFPLFFRQMAFGTILSSTENYGHVSFKLSVFFSQPSKSPKLKKKSSWRSG